MNEQSGENLREVFGKFFDDDKTCHILEDISRTERIFGESPAPSPEQAVLEKIRARLAIAMEVKKANRSNWTAGRIVAAAASFAAATAITVIIFNLSPISRPGAITASLIPATVWETNDTAAADADLASLSAEIEQVEKSVLALNGEENGRNTENSISQIENELTEIAGEFWKG